MRFSHVWRGGPAFFILFGGVFLLLSIILLIVFVNTLSALQRDQAGRCTITAKQLIQEEEQQTHTNNGQTYTTTTTVYRPDFQFTVQTADNHSYPAQGYDALGSSSSDRDGQQTIIDQYTVGKTYPCWYNPANPTQAVLTRQFNWLLFFIPGSFFCVGAVCIIVGIIAVFQRLFQPSLG